MVAKIDSVRRAGQDVTASMYPYPASSNTLASCFPPWASENGRLLDNLRDPAARARVLREMTDTTKGALELCQFAPQAVMAIGFTRPEYAEKLNGLRLPEIAQALGKPWAEAVIDVVLAEQNRLSKITFGMDEKNVAMQLRRPWVMIGSDAGGLDPDSARGLTHPRAYGTFARVLGKYVREDSVFPLEEAVRRMTSLTAGRLGLRDRGLLREGFHADIVVFDPATVGPGPVRRVRDLPAGGERLVADAPTGVAHIVVNGTPIRRDGTSLVGRLDEGPGQVIRSTGTGARS